MCAKDLPHALPVQPVSDGDLSSVSPSTARNRAPQAREYDMFRLYAREARDSLPAEPQLAAPFLQDAAKLGCGIDG
jgi:hypothetical protein